MQIVTIIPTKPDFTDATVTIRNVNLPLLEKQRKAFIKATEHINSFNDELSGLENFLNEICDSLYHQKDNTKPETYNTQPEPQYFLFGRDACRAYSEDGIEALAEYIESGEGYFLYKFTGDAIDLISKFSGWDDYVILTKDEYDKISEL